MPRLRSFAVHPGEVQLIAPPPTIRFFRKLRIRLAAARDRRRRIDSDVDRHTAYSRWLLHEALLADAQARLWARDRIRPLAAEVAALEDRLGEAPSAPNEPIPSRPDGSLGLTAGALWAQDVRSFHAARAEYERAKAARSADRDRLARLRSEIEAIDGHAVEVRAEWREFHKQEVAMYVHARSRKRSAQTNPLPDYPSLPAYPEVRQIGDGGDAERFALEQALTRASNHVGGAPAEPAHQR